MAEINFSRKSIQSLFSEMDNFAVPTYQRGYAWEANQWEDLWNDLQEVATGNEPDHFLGQIVVNELEGTRYVVDGQQRITTVVILLAVLRDQFDLLDDSQAKVRADDIQADLIENMGHYRFRQSEQLGEFFSRLVQQRGKFESNRATAKTESEKNLVKAYQFFNNKVKDSLNDIKSAGERTNYLQRQKKALTDHNFVMLISTMDESSAFIIFETLNARGRDLNSSDLLKNHLFRQAKGDSEIKSSWDNMMDSLDNNSELATRFIRAYWNATQPFTTEKKLYRALNKKIKSSVDAEEFVAHLANLSDIYASLDDPKRGAGFSDKKVLNQISILKDLGAKTYYPLILVMAQKHFSEADILTVLYKVTSFTVRNFTIGGLVANKFEKSFAVIANDLYDGAIMTVNEINRRISDEMISDQQFINSIQTASVKKERAARYILSELAYGEEDDIDLNEIKVVMLNANVEDADRLGNKVLLTKEENKEAKKSSKDKERVIANSIFIETRDMSNRVNTITSEEIQKRQESWALNAVQIWGKMNDQYQSY